MIVPPVDHLTDQLLECSRGMTGIADDSPESQSRIATEPGALAVVVIACPLCSSKETAPVITARDHVYRVPGEYRVVRCVECGHRYLNPRPADEALMRGYPSDYAPHLGDSDVAEASSTGDQTDRPRWRQWASRVPFAKASLRRLGQQHATVMPVPPRPGTSRLLEVGCAHGGYLVEAERAGWRVDGIEPDRNAAERAQQRGFDVSVGTLTGARHCEDQSREAIAAWMVLEHVPDPLEFLREAYRILTPGGMFCISVPNAAAIERKLFGRYWLGYDAPRHLQHFTTRQLTRLLEREGFVDVKVQHQASLRYWWGSLAAWGSARWPRADWPRRWMSYFTGEPPGWLKYAAMVPEQLLAAAHQSGRITVTARKIYPASGGSRTSLRVRGEGSRTLPAGGE